MTFIAITLMAQSLTMQAGYLGAQTQISAEQIAANWWTANVELVDRPDGGKGLRFHIPDEGQTWPWNTGAASPTGLLQGGREYRIRLSCETESLQSSVSGFYLIVRAESIGYGVDRWLKWRGKPNKKRTEEISLTLPEADDYRLYLGVHFSGTWILDSITIEEGGGWQTWTEADLPEADPKTLPEVTGPEPFAIDLPRIENAPVFCVSDYGAVSLEEGGLPPNAPARNLQAFQAAVNAAPKTGGAIIRVPTGTYDFPTRGSIVLGDFEDLLFDGGGSLFVYGTAERPMAIILQRLHRVELRNFRMDWDWSIHALAYYGQVTDADPYGAWFDILFPDEPDLEANRIFWQGMNPIDPETGIYRGGYQIGAFEAESVTKTGPGAFRVVPTIRQPVRVGETYLVRNYTYNRFAIDMADNRHLTLRDIVIHSFPGVGFHVNGDQQYWQLLGCRIAHPEGERRPITTTTDGYHVARSKGYSILDGVEFGGAGDDAINIHDNNSLGARVVDTHTIVAENVLAWRNYFSIGDPIEFRNGDLSPIGYTSVLTEIAYNQSRQEATMRFQDPVPPDLPRDAILFNRRYDSSRFIIRNSRFFENSTRAILMHTSHGLVENNVFENHCHEAIRIETGWDSRWGEGYTVENLVVRGNTIRYPNAYGPNEGAAVHMGVYLPSGHSRYPVFRRVLFEDNTIIGSPGPAFRIFSFQDVVFRNNTIEGTSPWPSRDPSGGVIRAIYGDGLYFLGNEWEREGGVVQWSPNRDPSLPRMGTY